MRERVRKGWREKERDRETKRKLRMNVQCASAAISEWDSNFVCLADSFNRIKVREYLHIQRKNSPNGQLFKTYNSLKRTAL